MAQNMIDSIAPLMREAGKIILGAHDADSENCLHVKPGTQNFATDYDIAVQTFLINGLKEAFPGAAFIAEEKENNAAVLQGELCFVIDPIDGTNCFIHNCRMSCISIAAVSRGHVVLGAVYNPYSGELAHATPGGGAFVNGKPAHVSERPTELAVAVFGPSPYYKDTLSVPTFEMARELFCSCVDIHRTGSAAIDLCSIASGSCDMFFELILQPWDIAAGALIIEEAGGIITQIDGSPITLEHPCSVLAGTPKTHPDLLRIGAKYAKYCKGKIYE